MSMIDEGFIPTTEFEADQMREYLDNYVHRDLDYRDYSINDSYQSSLMDTPYGDF